MRGMKSRKAKERLEVRIADWSKIVNDPKIKPGSYHKPGSMNGRK